MGFLQRLLTAPGRAYRWLYHDEKRLRKAQARGRASEGEPDADADYSEQQKWANDFSAWEEIDNMRLNFFFGSWATKKFRGMGKNTVISKREALEKEKAEAEGREYKSKLQLDLEAAARKREEKERIKAEKRRLKEERKRESY